MSFTKMIAKAQIKAEQKAYDAEVNRQKIAAYDQFKAEENAQKAALAEAQKKAGEAARAAIVPSAALTTSQGASKTNVSGGGFDATKLLYAIPVLLIIYKLSTKKAKKS